MASYLQPVSLLPTTLQEYEEALPDLSREKVLSIFREVETAKEVKLSSCREQRRRMMWEEDCDAGFDYEGIHEKIFKSGTGLRKLSCLSPIVEDVGGRQSGIGSSQAGAEGYQDHLR